jgi:hypothetical protein
VFGVNGYDTVLRALNFKEERIWPASLLGLKSWLGWLHTFGIRSASKYISGVRDEHIARGLSFLPSQVEQDAIKRFKHGASVIALTLPKPAKPPAAIFPVTPLHLRLFCRDGKLHASLDGRLFLAATAIAVYGGHRGAEFFSQSSGNPNRVSSRLLFESLTFDEPRCGEGMSIRFPPMKPDKTSFVDVWFPSIEKDITSPVHLLKNYLRSRRDPKHHEPLFQLADGSALSRTTFIAWTKSALQTIGVVIPPGQKLGSKSWRSGAVQAASAVPPEVDEKVKHTGRWKTSAWSSYAQGRAAHRVFAVALASRGSASRLFPELADHQQLAGGARTADRMPSPSSPLSPEPVLLESAVSRSPSPEATLPASLHPIAVAASAAESSDDEELAMQQALVAVSRSEAEEKKNKQRALEGKRVRKAPARLESGLTW